MLNGESGWQEERRHERMDAETEDTEGGAREGRKEEAMRGKRRGARQGNIRANAPWVPATLNPRLRSILEPPMQSSPTHCNRGSYRESLPPPYAQVAT